MFRNSRGMNFPWPKLDVSCVQHCIAYSRPGVGLTINESMCFYVVLVFQCSIYCMIREIANYRPNTWICYVICWPEYRLRLLFAAISYRNRRQYNVAGIHHHQVAVLSRSPGNRISTFRGSIVSCVPLYQHWTFPSNCCHSLDRQLTMNV